MEDIGDYLIIWKVGKVKAKRWLEGQPLIFRHVQPLVLVVGLGVGKHEPIEMHMTVMMTQAGMCGHELRCVLSQLGLN